MYICTVSGPQVVVFSFPLVQDVSRAVTSDSSKSEKQTLVGKLYSICLTSCEACRYQIYVAREHGQILVSHATLQNRQWWRTDFFFFFGGGGDLEIGKGKKRGENNISWQWRTAWLGLHNICIWRSRVETQVLNLADSLQLGREQGSHSTVKARHRKKRRNSPTKPAVLTPALRTPLACAMHIDTQVHGIVQGIIHVYF